MYKTVLAAAAALMVVGGANAKTIDFTKADDFGVAASGSTTSGTWDGVGLTFNALPDANDVLTHAGNGIGGAAKTECMSFGLACDVDGIGINNDEISEPFGGEELELIFDVVTTVTGIHVLDMFKGNGSERARVRFFDGVGSEIGGVDVVASAANSDSGYQFKSVFFEDVKSIKFNANRGPVCDNGDCRDDRDNDFALAAVNVVPLPAGAWLVLTGLGALGVTRMRRKKS